MKVNGKELDAPKPVDVPVTINGETIIFKVAAVLDYSDFESLCPVPQPPEVITPGNIRRNNPQDPKYRDEIKRHGERRTAWMFLQSLSKTEGLEWETVKEDDPETWENMEGELRKSLAPHSVNRLISKMCEANGLGEEVLREARESFLV